MAATGHDSAKTISVILADDHAVVRGALKALIDAREGLEVVGEAGDVESARLAVRDSKPDVLVLDVNMPGTLGVDAVSSLREEAPDTEIVLLTMERDSTIARRAIEAGARGYLFKDAAHLELIEAIRQASEGHDYLPPSVASVVRDQDEGEQPLLSPRETDVLRLMALGHTNREVAERLALSVRTVETHRAHIQQKLGLNSRPELTRYALDNHLIDA